VKCEFCHRDATGLINLRVYTRQGIEVCAECYKAIDSHRHKPYSKVMDKLALVEAGYQVNRKLATMPKSRWQVRG
jgi:ribosome-binding protein aMBF1 (putative translation factor)